MIRAPAVTCHGAPLYFCEMLPNRRIDAYIDVYIGAVTCHGAPHFVKCRKMEVNDAFIDVYMYRWAYQCGLHTYARYIYI